MMNGIDEITRPIVSGSGQATPNGRKKQRSKGAGNLPVRLVVSALLFACALLLKLPFLAAVILYCFAFLAAGGDYLLSFVKSILRLDFTFGPLFIIPAGIIAMAVGMYEQGALLIILFRIGELCAEYVYHRTISAKGLSVKPGNDLLPAPAESKQAAFLPPPDNTCSRTEMRVDSIAHVFTIFSLLAAVLTFIIPVVFFHTDWQMWFGRALVFLAIARPLALCLSVPLTYLTAISSAGKNGMLFANARAVNNLADVHTIVIEKTGILTTGRYKVAAVEPEKISIHSLLMIAAYTLSASRPDTAPHAMTYAFSPLTEAILKAFDGTIDSTLIEKSKVFPDKGALIIIKNAEIICGNAAMMEQFDIITGDDSEDECVLYAAVSGKYAGRLLLTDPLKNDASSAVFLLQKQNIYRIAMFSGDKEHATRKTAGALGIGDYYSECQPEDKKQIFNKMRGEMRERDKIAYIGDAAKDAQALSLADIGISLGTANVSGEPDIADIIILSDSPVRIADALSFARKTERIIKQNIAFHLIIKLLIIVIALFGPYPLLFAVIADACAAIISSLLAGKAMFSDYAVGRKK
jgi:Cd2+/Zn2+-exporting ATPase